MSIEYFARRRRNSAMPTDPTEVIAKRLRVLQNALGYGGRGKNKLIAQSIGVSEASWSQWIKDRRITLEGASALFQRHNVSLDWIYLGQKTSMPFDLMRRIEALTQAEKQNDANGNGN